MLRRSLILAATLLAFASLSFPSRAIAACANPAGIESQVMYNATHHVLQFCNGTNWINASARLMDGGESDPKVGTLTSPMGCTSNGTAVNCMGIDLATMMSSNLPVANLNSGTSASSSTMWRGDGTWGSFSETDAQVGALAGDLFCKANTGATAIDCNYSLTTTTLAGWWKFDDASGTTAVDSSGNGNTGTLTNGPTWTTGTIAGGLSLDNSNDYVNIPTSSSLTLLSALSISFWMKKTSLSGEDDLVSKSTDGSVVEYGVNSVGDEISFFYTSGGSLYGHETTSANLSTGTWYHVAVTYSDAADSAVIYINGVAKTTSSSGYDGDPATHSLESNGEPLRIGRIASGEAFDGIVDDVRVYNGALSAAEVTALYNNSTLNTGAAVNLATQVTGNLPVNKLNSGTSASSSTFWRGDGAWTAVPESDPKVGSLSPCHYCRADATGTQLNCIYDSSYDGIGWKLLGWWKFDENTGSTVADSSGNGMTGAFAGSPSPTWTTGHSGSALTFTASGEWVNIPYDALQDPTANISISLWVKRSGAQNNYATVFTKGWSGGAPTYASYTIDLNPNDDGSDVARFFLGYSGGFNDVTGITVADGVWTHLVGTWEGSEMILYINGEAVDSTYRDGTPIIYDGTSSIEIGSNFIGAVDDVRLYSGALTESQVYNLYNGTDPSCP